MIKIAPSILSADFSRLEKEIRRVEKAGADLLHIDIMDGHFVPNITIGPAVVKNIRQVTRLPLDVHLMIENPGKFVNEFIKAGSDMITVHIETATLKEIKKIGSLVRAKGLKFGISLNPATALSAVSGALKYADLILVMSVNPGFGGQAFIPSVVPKIRKLRAIFEGEISVDGGVNDRTAGVLIRSGVDILASGSYIFRANDVKSAIERIRNAK